MQTAVMNPMTHHRVLVIDAHYQAVNIVPLRKALTKLFSGRAKTEVYSKDGAVIGTSTFRLPSVIQLEAVVPRWKQRVRFCRKNVIVGRDRGICQYCQVRFPTEDLTLDHIVPRAQGGQTTWENVVAACIDCNQQKANRTPDQAGMKLMRRASRPNHLLDVIIKMDVRAIPTEWDGYWSVELEK